MTRYLPRQMPFLSVLMILTAVGSAGCGACPAMKCLDYFEAQILPAAGKSFAEGTYKITVVAESFGTTEVICAYAAGMLPPLGGLQGNSCSGSIGSLTLWLSGDETAFDLSFTIVEDIQKLTSLQITVALDQVVVGDKTFAPTFTPSYTKGEACYQDCVHGSVTMRLTD